MTDIKQREVWVPITGREGEYEVSNHGRVRSVDRVVHFRNRPNMLRGRVIVPSVDPAGRLSVDLSLQGVQHRRKVAALVLEAFVGPRPAGAVVRHVDDDFGNCRAENLTWGSRRHRRFETNLLDKRSPSMVS